MRRLKKARIAAREVRKRAFHLSEPESLVVDDVVAVRDEIDDQIFSVQVSHVPSDKPLKPSKGWSSRPSYWHDIVEHSNVHGPESVAVNYSDVFAGLKKSSIPKTLSRWKREMIEEKIIKSSKNKIPQNGDEVEKGLISDVNIRIDLGLSLDNTVLRNLALARLLSSDQMGLLSDNGGKHKIKN